MQPRHPIRHLLQTLRVVSVCRLASERGGTSGRSCIPYSTALTILGNSTARWRSRGSRGCCSLTGGSCCCTCGTAQLSLNEGESRTPVFGTVALMGGGVAAIAAVWVGGVTVRLNNGGVGALEASRAGVKLYILVSHEMRSSFHEGRLTPPASHVPTL